jgi:hypothetical protein
LIGKLAQVRITELVWREKKESMWFFYGETQMLTWGPASSIGLTNFQPGTIIEEQEMAVETMALMFLFQSLF